MVLSSIDISINFGQVISSIGLLKSFKYGCLKAYSTVSLLFGFIVNNLLMRSQASSEAFGNSWLNDFFFSIVIWSRHYLAKLDYIDSISYRDGRPITSRTLDIWFRVEFPGNNAFP